MTSLTITADELLIIENALRIARRATEQEAGQHGLSITAGRLMKRADEFEALNQKLWRFTEQHELDAPCAAFHITAQIGEIA